MCQQFAREIADTLVRRDRTKHMELGRHFDDYGESQEENCVGSIHKLRETTC